jgi:TRAP-type mannitol/chloroaromatic compound transport system substrate-binding protein
MKKLLAGGTKLHSFSPPIMQASLKATKELYTETAATNPNFKKVLESLNGFTANGYQWFQVAELGYDSFMARNAQG